MLPSIRVLSTVVGLILLFPLFTLAGGADDEMIDNPMYVGWANFKPGTSVTHTEKTKYGDERKPFAPDGVDEKVIVHKLLSVSPDKVTIQTVVSEREFLGTVESAPTKTTYPSKIKKSYLLAVMEEHSAKVSEETIKVLGKETKCKTWTGIHKGKDDVVVEFKLHRSKTVPGGVVDRSRITRQGDKLVAETVITLKAFTVKGE